MAHGAPSDAADSGAASERRGPSIDETSFAIAAVSLPEDTINGETEADLSGVCGRRQRIRSDATLPSAARRIVAAETGACPPPHRGLARGRRIVRIPKAHAAGFTQDARGVLGALCGLGITGLAGPRQTGDDTVPLRRLYLGSQRERQTSAQLGATRSAGTGPQKGAVTRIAPTERPIASPQLPSTDSTCAALRGRIACL